VGKPGSIPASSNCKSPTFRDKCEEWQWVKNASNVLLPSLAHPSLGQSSTFLLLSSNMLSHRYMISALFNFCHSFLSVALLLSATHFRFQLNRWVCSIFSIVLLVFQSFYFPIYFSDVIMPKNMFLAPDGIQDSASFMYSLQYICIC